VQHAQEAAAETEAHRLGAFRLEMQRRVVELELSSASRSAGKSSAMTGTGRRTRAAASSGNAGSGSCRRLARQVSVSPTGATVHVLDRGD
jgi:hypothetical protein